MGNTRGTSCLNIRRTLGAGKLRYIPLERASRALSNGLCWNLLYIWNASVRAREFLLVLIGKCDLWGTLGELHVLILGERLEQVSCAIYRWKEHRERFRMASVGTFYLYCTLLYEQVNFVCTYKHIYQTLCLNIRRTLEAGKLRYIPLERASRALSNGLCWNLLPILYASVRASEFLLVLIGKCDLWGTLGELHVLILGERLEQVSCAIYRWKEHRERFRMASVGTFYLYCTLLYEQVNFVCTYKHIYQTLCLNIRRTLGAYKLRYIPLERASRALSNGLCWNLLYIWNASVRAREFLLVLIGKCDLWGTLGELHVLILGERLEQVSCAIYRWKEHRERFRMASVGTFYLYCTLLYEQVNFVCTYKHIYQTLCLNIRRTLGAGKLRYIPLERASRALSNGLCWNLLPILYASVRASEFCMYL